MTKKKNHEYIETLSLSLEEFLEVILLPFADRMYYPVNMFPTDKHRDQYLSTITTRTEQEVRDLLRQFLPKNCSYGKDTYMKSFYQDIDEKDLDEKMLKGLKRLKRTEYYRRLMSSNDSSEYVWEGLTWILDLLPNFPNEAIRAIDAFILSNCQFLPDNALSALSDCSTILRAWYLDKEQPREIFLNLLPKEFEQLVAELYSIMKYSTQLTQTTHDGGIDILAIKDKIGKKEKLVIQCKRYTNKITLNDVKVLHSTTLSTKSTKGVFITSSDFTSSAKKFAENNPSIELINHNQLSKLLNKHCGPYWTSKVGQIIMNQKRSNP